jgi:hypothetical protein
MTWSSFGVFIRTCRPTSGHDLECRKSKSRGFEITKQGRCKNENIPELSVVHLWFEFGKHGTKIKYELGPAVT